MADLRKKTCVKDGTFRSIVENSIASLWPSIRSLAENFGPGFNWSVNESFREGSIASHIHTAAAVEGITLRSSKGAASDDGDGAANVGNVVDLPLDPEVIELKVLFLVGLHWWTIFLVYFLLSLYFKDVLGSLFLFRSMSAECVLPVELVLVFIYLGRYVWAHGKGMGTF